MVVRAMCMALAAGNAIVLGATNYVSLGGSHVAPFTNWADAAHDIQSAINAAVPGNVVMVQAGAYHGYGGYAGNASNVLVINKSITVKSIYYADDGELQDTWPAWCEVNGLNARRCVYIGSPGAVLEGFKLMGGYAPEHGGGAYLAGGTLEQCMITDCRAGIQGGGVNIVGSGTVRNTLIARNRANYGGGGVNAVTGTSYLTVYNSIMYHNTPQFEDLSGDNYRLRSGSACLDRATNLAWQATGCDCETYPRIIGVHADVGAFERSPVHYVAPAASSIWPYLSWSTAATNIETALRVTGSGDTVMAASGTYVVVENDEGLGIEIPREITLHGVSGPASTVINGKG